MEQHKEIANGLFAILVNIIAYMFGHLYPIITTLGALAGSFLAIHGAFIVIKNWLKGKKNKSEFIPWHPDDTND